jgi:Flp pilus assembly pilin Flp
MRNPIHQLNLAMVNLISSETGQDLVEYALLMMMISLALVSAMGSLASMVNHVFTNISNSLA